MSLPPLPLTEGCLVLDNSAIETFQTCSRAFEYSRLAKRVSVGSRPALDFGSAIHLALEWRYKRLGNDSPTMIDEDEQAQVIARYFDEHPCPDDDFRNAQFAVDMMKRYNSRYQIEPFNIMRFDEPQTCGHCEGLGRRVSKGVDLSTMSPAQTEPCTFCNGTGKNSNMVELSFLLPLFTCGDIPVLYSGKIDLPVLLDDQLIIIDHKTTSMLGEQFFDELRMSAQPLGYCWAMQTIHPEKQVGGFMINAIRTKDIPQYVRDGKARGGLTPDKWWEEAMQRDVTYLRPGQLDEWHANVIALVEEMMWNYQRGYMPLKTKWCVGKYGKCPYFQVCSLPPEQRNILLQSDLYQENTWSPLTQPSQPKS